MTGGAGFIGSNIIRELLRMGNDVRVLDNFSTGKRENIDDILNDIQLVEGDIRSYHILRNVVEDVDFILHHAALPSVPRSINDPITTHEVNLGGTLNVLEAARDAKVKRVIYASSSSIYGNNLILPKREDMNPVPLSPYAVSKLAGENYCKVFSQIYGLETVCLRYFNVFGPRQDPDSQYSAVIPKFISAMRKNIQPTVYGDGKQSRDFTYVANIVQANILACRTIGISGEVFNVACGKSFTVLDLIHKLNELLQKNISPQFVNAREGEIKHSKADIKKSVKILDYKSEYGFEYGLSETIAFYDK